VDSPGTFDLNGRPIQGNDTLLTKTFTAPGRETVTLVAKDINGCRDTIRRSMSIYSIEPDFLISDTLICLPGTVTFTDNSQADTTLVRLAVELSGTGNRARDPASRIPTPAHPEGDGFVVSLRLEDALSCPQNDTAFVRVYTPVSSIVTDPVDRGICVAVKPSPLAVRPSVREAPSLDFSWEFSNGPNSRRRGRDPHFPGGR
jgi:hypothetical protein